MKKVVQGFKDFIMRGNVVDLAVGIVIGAAFTTVVTAFTEGFIKPLIQLIGGGSSPRRRRSARMLSGRTTRKYSTAAVIRNVMIALRKVA